VDDGGEREPNDEVPAAEPVVPEPPPLEPPPLEPPPLEPPLAPPSPSDAPTSAWQVPAPPPTPATSGWRLPTGPAPAPGVADHVIAGVGARGIAWVLDGLLVGLIPAALSLTLIDWSAFIDEVVRSVRDQGGGEPPVVALPVTPEVLLVTLIGVGISFVYLVGLWTSGGQATVGMRGLRMRVVDATTGRGLSLAAAVRRWFALGGPLSLLAVLPGLEGLIGIVGLALPFVLLLSTIADDRHQGLHDRVASSVVIRATSSGAGSTIVAGCIVLAIIGALVVLVTVATFVAVGPVLDRLIIEPRNVI
jgi:uncharacterized RDD family membrane protein YckC